jgi:hypothetical protein
MSPILFWAVWMNLMRCTKADELAITAAKSVTDWLPSAYADDLNALWHTCCMHMQRIIVVIK